MCFIGRMQPSYQLEIIYSTLEIMGHLQWGCAFAKILTLICSWTLHVPKLEKELQLGACFHVIPSHHLPSSF